MTIKFNLLRENLSVTPRKNREEENGQVTRFDPYCGSLCHEDKIVDVCTGNTRTLEYIAHIKRNKKI